MCFVMVKKSTGDIIRDIRRQMGLTQEEFAESLGISNTYLAMIETGKRKGKFILRKIADKYGIDVGILEGEKELPYQYRPKHLKAALDEAIRRYEELEIREIPILCRVPCGYPMPNEQQAEGYEKIVKADLGYAKDKPDLYVLIATGESLAGDGIHDGYRMVIDPTPPSYPEGAIYAVRVGSEVTCKHIYHIDNKIKLIPSNHDYRELIYNADEVEILGKVILCGIWNKLS